MDFASSFSIDSILRNNPSSRNDSQMFEKQNAPQALTLAERLAGMYCFHFSSDFYCYVERDMLLFGLPFHAERCDERRAGKLLLNNLLNVMNPNSMIQNI